MHDLKCREGTDKERDTFTLAAFTGRETILWRFKGNNSLMLLSVNFLLVFLIGELHQMLAEAIAAHIIQSYKN